MTFEDDHISPVIPNSCQTIKVMRYSHRREGWKHMPRTPKQRNKITSSAFQIITWNVDAFSPYATERMLKILRHLEEEELEHKERDDGERQLDPYIICLQEVSIEAFEALRRDTWVQENFLLTPSNETKWPDDASYGNVTMISSNIPVLHARILHYNSTVMQRAAIIVDVVIGFPRTRPTSEKSVRVINTHLESPCAPEQGIEQQYVADQNRLMQLKLCAKLAWSPEAELGGIVAGDMNAVNDADREAPDHLTLRDVIGDRPAQEFGDENPVYHTWGFQSPPEDQKYGTARLDKILYANRGLLMVARPPRKVGDGLRLEDCEDALGNDIFVSDHCGLWSRIMSIDRS